MTHHINSSKNWKPYQFEIEKYLAQLSNNPYCNELEEVLKDAKKNKLRKYLKFDFIDKLDNTVIDIIIQKYCTDALLIQLNTKLNTSISDNMDTNKKLQILNNILTNDSIIEDIVEINPTKLRISTMTVCSFLGETIDTEYLYDCFDAPKDILDTDPNNKNIYKPTLKELIIGCKSKNKPIKGHFKKNKKGNFYNSVALNVLIDNNKCINVKLFNNGKVQMTGVPNEEQGKRALDLVIELIKSMPDDLVTGKKVAFNKKNISMKYFNTVLINSDYFCGFEIQRENLYQILSEKYDLSISYEPENYPGVKLEYFWNRHNLNTPTEGHCICKQKCIGKGLGNGDGDCKKITVSTFQSGKIIVTGGRSLEQLNYAYNFINKILKDNYKLLCKNKNNTILKNDLNKTNSKVFFIKKTTIINYKLYKTLAGVCISP